MAEISDEQLVKAFEQVGLLTDILFVVLEWKLGDLNDYEAISKIAEMSKKKF